MRLAESQERLIEKLVERGDEGIDAESRMRLRSIDVQMLRILEEISAGRQESMTELRTDLAALTRVLEQDHSARYRAGSRPGERLGGRVGHGPFATHRRALSGLDLAGFLWMR